MHSRVEIESLHDIWRRGDTLVDRTTVGSLVRPPKEQNVLAQVFVSQRLVEPGTNLGPFHFVPHDISEVIITLEAPSPEASDAEPLVPVVRTRRLVIGGEFLSTKAAIKAGLRRRVT